MASPQLNILRKALELLHTRERLASALQITAADLDAYLTGLKPLPPDLYVQAIDMVASRELAERRLEEIVSTMVADRWIHQRETGLTLPEFQVLHAAAEEWESLGRITILETREKALDRGPQTVAIRLQRRDA